MTMKWGKTPVDQFPKYSGMCEVSKPGKEWMKIKCTKDGVKTHLFKDMACKTPVDYVPNGVVEVKWGECFYAAEVAPNAYKVATTQTDFSKHPSDGAVKMPDGGHPVAKSFDKYFYYAIDHQGKMPGSMMPGCRSNRDCGDDSDDDDDKMHKGGRHLKGHKGDHDDDDDDMKGGMKKGPRRRGGMMRNNMCCAHAKIHEMGNGKKHELMRCMNKKVVHTNKMMSWPEAKMELSCMDGMRRKGAQALVVAASAASLVAMTLF